MDLKSTAEPPIKSSKADYGWILVDRRGQLAENLTRTHLVPFYRSESRAREVADQANAALSEKECER